MEVIIHFIIVLLKSGNLAYLMLNDIVILTGASNHLSFELISVIIDYILEAVCLSDAAECIYTQGKHKKWQQAVARVGLQ